MADRKKASKKNGNAEEDCKLWQQSQLRSKLPPKLSRSPIAKFEPLPPVIKEAAEGGKVTLDKKFYEKELRRLQIELVKLQEWVKFKKLKVVVIFEGRDAAGKGGTIKRITECLNPRVCRVVALPAPTEREKNAVVLPALRFAPACRRRDCADGPQLVQPRRRRAGDGLLL